MTNITLTCSTIGEYSGMSPQAQSKIYSKLPASWNSRIQGWLLRLHKSRKKEKKNRSQRHSNASIPQRSSRCPPRYRYSFTGSLLIASCQAVLLPIVWAAPQKTCTRCDGLPSLQDNHTRQSKTKAKKIITDPCHPNNSFFSLLQSEKPCKSLGSIPRGSGAAPTPKLSRHLMRTLPGACSTNNTAETFIMHIWSLSHIHIAIMVSQI